MSYFLRSSRLGFRHWTEADLPLALALWTDSAVMGYMGGPMTPDEAEARLRLEMHNQASYGIQYWPVFELDTGQHAGCAGLRRFHDQADVGVHIHEAYWSGPYGEEAARTIIDYALYVVGAQTVVASHFPENRHSKSLIQRLGFVYTHDEVWGEPACRTPTTGLNEIGESFALI